MKLTEIRESAFDKMTRAIVPELNQALKDAGVKAVSTVVPVPSASIFSGTFKPAAELSVCLAIEPKNGRVSDALHNYLLDNFDEDLLVHPRVFIGAAFYLVFMEPRREAS